jgi:hypothetical protein
MTLSNLKSRFVLDKDDSEAALFMQERVKDAVAHMVWRCIVVLCHHAIINAFGRPQPPAFMMNSSACKTASTFESTECPLISAVC